MRSLIRFLDTPLFLSYFCLFTGFKKSVSSFIFFLFSISVNSSQQITETHDELKSMSGHIKNSRKLLTKYGRREVTDKLLIVLALIFFFSTVLYILKKRMFSSSVVVDSAEELVNTHMGGEYSNPQQHQDL